MSGAAHAALVTGASSGIGREIARQLAGEGRNLFLVSRSSDRLATVASALSDEFSVRVDHLAVDLALPDSVERVIEAVTSKGIRIDFLVNNAGVGLLGRFHETSANDQRRLIELDVRTPVALAHAFLPAMVEAGSGVVLNVASMASFTPGPLMATYYASKAFVRSFSEGLARELRGSGVTVTALCPGPVPTGFAARAGFSQRSKRTVPPLSARRVAEIGLKGAKSGKRVVVPGFMNKVLAFATRFVPSRIAVDAVYNVQSSRLESGQS